MLNRMHPTGKHWLSKYLGVGGIFVVCRPTREFFTHMDTAPLLVKVCKCSLMLGTCDHWEVPSLACHTYCDPEHPFEMAISEDLWHSHLLPSVWPWGCHYLSQRPWSVAAGTTPNLSNTQPFACGVNALTDCATAAASNILKNYRHHRP